MGRHPSGRTISVNQLLALAAILVAAGLLRFWDIGGPSLWTDELYTLNFSSLPHHQLWSDWMVRETNPPLFYSMLSAWIAVFGDGEVAARSLACILGILCVAVVYLNGRALHSHYAGLLAAGLTAVSAQQLQYSQFVRGYTLGFLAAGLCVYALLKLTDEPRPESSRAQAPWLALYAGSAAVAFYTHTTFFALPILANIYILWFWWVRTNRSWPDAARWIAANGVLLLVSAWWIGMTLQQMKAGAEPIAWIETPTIREAIMKTTHVYASRSLGLLNLVLAAIFGLLLAWGVWRLRIDRKVLAIVFGAGVPLLLFIISLKQPVLMERTLYWAQIVYLPCLAVGVLELPVSRFRPAIAAACVIALLADALNWRASDYREPWRQIATTLRDKATGKDALLTYSADAAVNLSYYCRKLGCSDVKVFALKVSSGREVLEDSFAGQTIDNANAQSILGGFDRIWVMQRGFEQDPATVLTPFAHQESANVLSSDTRRRDLPVNHMTLTVWAPGTGS